MPKNIITIKTRRANYQLLGYAVNHCGDYSVALLFDPTTDIEPYVIAYDLQEENGFYFWSTGHYDNNKKRIKKAFIQIIKTM